MTGANPTLWKMQGMKQQPSEITFLEETTLSDITFTDHIPA